MALASYSHSYIIWTDCKEAIVLTLAILTLGNSAELRLILDQIPLLYVCLNLLFPVTLREIYPGSLQHSVPSLWSWGVGFMLHIISLSWLRSYVVPFSTKINQNERRRAWSSSSYAANVTTALWTPAYRQRHDKTLWRTQLHSSLAGTAQERINS